MIVRRIDAQLTRLANQPLWQFVVVVYTVSLVVKIAIMMMASEAAVAVGQPLLRYQGDAQRSLLVLFIQGVVLAPLLETWLFQQLPIRLVGRFSRGLVLPILLSSLIFTLLHYHRLLAGMLNAAVMGLVLASAYCYRARRPDGHPFIAVAAIHGLHNLLAWSVQWAQRSGLVPAG
ncbi:CPBP family intramembrane metalloprotease [Chitinimonas arctica]|uniref:CPBP family intramembrane metalloprotease n=1 Tax=Chitinimonas arctica TaxID=2594795 RepID=A0A516SC64_9NEIS|nr:CPBP family intramembrane glutamic endopeptidase [Chitinimonas arctica]QDQ25741.1 CPBP family intramembrane metalloprotease [Chitinimonas arctica]